MQSKVQNLIKDIPIPSLNSGQYGEDVRVAFETINDNFKKLSYDAFIRGEAGENMYAYTVTVKTLHDNNAPGSIITLDNGHQILLSGLYDKLKKSIQHAITPKGLEEIDGITWDKNINEGGLQYESEIILFYSYDPSIYNSIVKTKILSSTIFYFLDARFNRDMSGVDESEYKSLIDTSCTLIIHSGEDVDWISSQLYPTLYYKDGIGFCWMINGIKTGLIARGPKGEPGESSQMYMVVGEKDVDVSSKVNIIGVFDNNSTQKNSWISWDKFINTYNNWENIGASPVIVFIGETNGDDFTIDGSEGYWISKAFIEYTDPIKAYAICEPDENVGKINTSDVVRDTFNIISSNPSDNSSIKGLYIPFRPGKVGKADLCHFISAIKSSTPIEDSYSTLVVAPTLDIHGTPKPEVDNDRELQLNYGNIQASKNFSIGKKLSVGATTTNNPGEFACGQSNISHKDTIFSVGNGSEIKPEVVTIYKNTIEVTAKSDVYIDKIGGSLGYNDQDHLEVNSITGSTGSGPAPLQDVINYPTYPLKPIYYYPAKYLLPGDTDVEVKMVSQTEFRTNRLILINTNKCNISGVDINLTSLVFNFSGRDVNKFCNGDTWIIRRFGPIHLQLKFDLSSVGPDGVIHEGSNSIDIRDDSIYYISYIVDKSSLPMFIISK